MAKIIQFPVKLIPPRDANLTGKSDMMEIIDKVIASNFSHGRSQGFMVGIFVANALNVLMQFVFK